MRVDQNVSDTVLSRSIASLRRGRDVMCVCARSGSRESTQIPLGPGGITDCCYGELLRKGISFSTLSSFLWGGLKLFRVIPPSLDFPEDRSATTQGTLSQKHTHERNSMSPCSCSSTTPLTFSLKAPQTSRTFPEETPENRFFLQKNLAPLSSLTENHHRTERTGPRNTVQKTVSQGTALGNRRSKNWRP